MKLSSVIGAGLLVFLPLIACGGDSDSGGSGSSKDALFQELCGALDDCCKLASKPNAVSSCVAFYTAFTADKTVDPAKSQACIDRLKAVRKSGELCANDDAADDACDSVLSDGGSSGTKQPGEVCTESTECAKTTGATDVFCQTNFTSGPEGSKQEKYCVVTVLKKEGEACKDLPKGYDGECDKKAGAFCDFSAGVCKLPAAEGQPCSQGNTGSCQKGLYCALNSGKPVCAPKLAAGTACESFSQSCLEGTYCGPSKTCVAQLTDGSDCQTSESCASGTCLNSKCDKDSGSSGGLLCFK